MTAPIVIFGVTLPLVDMITDLRMIIRLYVGVPRCAVKETSLPLYNSTCFKSDDIGTYCQENPGECSTEQHPIFASMLLGKLIMMLLGRIGEKQSLFHFYIMHYCCFSTIPSKLHGFIFGLVQTRKKEVVDIGLSHTQPLSNFWFVFTTYT